jgi:hypothetical protein
VSRRAATARGRAEQAAASHAGRVAASDRDAAELLAGPLTARDLEDVIAVLYQPPPLLRPAADGIHIQPPTPTLRPGDAR